ncbi:hypothetical protein P389DRAFT_51641 [Cystobasidium minutum MCA 4210]|uniref:uncharacterized protein n=1 Tax=Cystobasidium minutum MCA 4210 TaxID=1397322 RepID=UPI0034CD6155|eukprot:jgi/Rhomi1/51641/CE51640_5127
MLHKAAHSFSPFKLQHLHTHIRSALNLNLGQNAGQNFNQANASGSGSSSSSTLGGTAPPQSGSSSSNSSSTGGNAKYHPGRSYNHYYYYNRTVTPAANAATGNDGAYIQKQLLDEEEEAASSSSKVLAHTSRNLRWRTGRRFAGRQRSSSLSNPGLTTGLPLDSASSPSSPVDSSNNSNLPRSSPYSFNQAQLQARYRHAFSQAKRRPSHERLLTLSPLSVGESSTTFASKRTITTSASSSTPTSSALHVSKTAPSSPRIQSRRLPSEQQQQARRNSTSTSTQQAPAISDDVINAASTLTETAQKTISPEHPTATSTSVPESAKSSSVQQPSSSTQSKSTRQQQERRDVRSSGDIRYFTQDLQPGQTHFTESETKFQRDLSQLAKYQEYEQIKSFIRAYRASPAEWTERKHAHAIKMLGLMSLSHSAVSAGSTLASVLYDLPIELYNDYFENDMVPHIHTIGAALQAYLGRSQATLDLLNRQQLHNNAARLAPAASYWIDGAAFPVQNQEGAAAEVDGMLSDSNLASLRQQSDEDYAAAKRIVVALGEELRSIHSNFLDSIIACAAHRGDIDTALIVFGILEADSRINHSTFKNLILTYAKGGDARGLFTIFESYLKGLAVLNHDVVLSRHHRQTAAQFLEASAEGNPDVSASLGVLDQSGKYADSEVDICNAAIYGYLLVGDGVKALDVLERMMASTGRPRDRTPQPNDTTLLNLVKGFAESGDLDSAFRWANRIHATPTPEDLPTPPKLQDTFDAIIATTSDIAAIQKAAGKTPMLPQLGAHVQAITSSSSVGQASQGSNNGTNAPMSPTSSAGNVTDLGSIFSDPSMRSRTLSITPPPYITQNASAARAMKPDYRLSHTLDDMIRSLRRGETGKNVTDIYDLIKSNAEAGVYAHPETLARFAQILGVLDESQALEDIYRMATAGLAGLDNQADQAAAWAYLEDRMLIAMAKKGDLQKAAMHRDKILAAGAAPSADAYAAMITSAKDTTDDATVALELFEEARRFGVVPNLFLFNILISKISKARRTHLALSYFEQMKAIGIQPSAVTYGSVIAACCRTGDEKAATFLFNEMINSRGYKPRVPPFNTMMQFYITTKPDREKALSYFDAMLRAGVPPTGHTYKLLLDAYGSLEPVDLDSVKDVFSRLLEDPNISHVTGGHWASLIHAYGTVKQDLNKTLEIFDSIAAHPASQRSAHSHALPDVICYEALFNALVAMKRIDLVEKYLARMQAQYVRPTAYIWNVIIRAYTVVGDIEKARAIFESLSDPESGVAAAGNHASAETSKSDDVADSSEAASQQVQQVDADGHPIVYREPSTFEAMIKAEMEIGSPEKAQELLERAIARAFPPAIISKLERMTKGEDSGSPAFAPSVTQPVH